jgi:hypothetical protein
VRGPEPPREDAVLGEGEGVAVDRVVERQLEANTLLTMRTDISVAAHGPT